MSQVRKHIKVVLGIFAAAVFALNCAGNNKTQFQQNMESDAGKPAPSYNQWVGLIGQQKTDQLYAGVGQDSLNLLAYGVGVSNMVQLINAVTSTSKLIDLIGNDFIAGTAGQTGPGGMYGLGSLVTLNLLKQVDTQMQTNISNHLPAPGGSTPTDQDTIMNVANIVNTLSAVEVNQKMVYMFGPAGFNVQRNLGGANDVMLVGRLAKIVAHVEPTVPTCALKLCPLLQGLAGGVGGDITAKLAPLMMYNTAAGVPWADKLVDTLQTVTNIANMVTVIQGVTAVNVTAKMAVIIDTVVDCTKMGYTINNVTTLATLVSMINNVSVTGATRMGTLINEIENATSYTAIQGTLAPNNWHGGAQTWGSPAKAAPYSTAGSGGAISVVIASNVASSFTAITAGSGYHPNLTVTNVFAGCTTQPTMNITLSAGTIVGATVANPGAGCTNGTFALTLSDPTNDSGMVRLVNMINGITPANYFQMLELIDTVSNIDKLVVLIQDGVNNTDLVQMLNQMSPTGYTVAAPGCTGVLTISGGTCVTVPTATGFVSTVPAPNSYNYITMTNTGNCSVMPTTVTDAGCGVIPAAQYTMVMNGSAITGIYFNTLPVNVMAEMVENIATTNVPRLVEVVNGERIWNNTGTQAPAATSGTYLNKMVQLLSGLNPQIGGPIKVTQMINGVTNTDKIIDLIYGVTITGNLSTIINGIFDGTLGLGCSDSATSTYLTAGTCDVGASATAGNGFVWGMRNQSVNTMVYVLQNVVNQQNLIGMINGTDPNKVAALINHVASSGNGATTFNSLNSTQVEDPNSATCGTCTGALANTSTYTGAGMRLVKVIDYSAAATYPYDLAFLLNKTSVVKVAKVMIQMSIGQTATGSAGPMNQGAGKLGSLMTMINGTNCWNQLNGVTSTSGIIPGSLYAAAPIVTFTGGLPTACTPGTDCPVGVATVSAGGALTNVYITDPGTHNYSGGAPTITLTPVSGGAGGGATAVVGSCGTTRGLVQNTGTNPLTNIGKGKMVNMVNYITGASDTAAMNQLAYILNGINNAQKLGDLINKVTRSSNVVALMNGVIDPKNNTSTTDLLNFMNNLPVGQVHKLVALMQQLSPAIETPLYTLAGMDQDLVAKLMAPYATKTAPTNNVVNAISLGSPGVVTTAAAHGLTAGRQVVFGPTSLPTPSTATIATGLNMGQLYFVVAPTATTFQVAATPGGAAINTTAAAVIGNGITLFSSEPAASSGVGTAVMNALMGSLQQTVGSAYAVTPTLSFGAGCATNPTTTANVGTGMLTDFIYPFTAGDCTAVTNLATTVTPTVTGTGTIGGIFMPTTSHGAPSGANTDADLKSIFITDNGSGYGAAPVVSFTGCAGTSPAVTATISGLTSVDINTPGSGCTTNPAVTFSGGTAAATAYVAGPIATLSGLYGGKNYTTGQTCPIQGSGGTGATVVITAAVSPGPITALGVITGGADYMVGQTVTIGGNARGHALVTAAGAIPTGANLIVDYGGCGYVAATVTVTGCTVNPTATATVTAGVVTSFNVTVAGSGCPANPDVIVTGAHGDGASATVATASNGSVVLISLSNGADNLASVLSNQEKAPLTAAVNYASTAPSIGAQEAMVRLIWHGTTYNGGTFPGVGPAHLAYNVMSQINTGTSVMTVINMMNSDTTSMADLDVLIGCTDGVEFGAIGYPLIASVTVNDFETYCRANASW